MNFRVEMAVVLEDTQYGQFKKISLQEDHIFLFKNNDKMWFDPDVLCWHCLLVKGENSKDGCALPGFVDSKNEEKTERNAGYLVVSQSGGGMLRQDTREGIRRTPANRGMRAHRIVKGLDISEDVCHGMCP